MKKLFLVLLVGISSGSSVAGFAATPQISIQIDATKEAVADRAEFQRIAESIRLGVLTQRKIVIEPMASFVGPVAPVPADPQKASRLNDHSRVDGGSDAWAQAYQRSAGNGDVYFLWGNLDSDWTEKEYDKFYSVSKWLVKHKFRSIVNPVAYESDVREAVTNPNTAVIIWSSHGNTDGEIFDSRGNALPVGVFYDNASPNFREIVLSNCYGEATVNHYSFRKGTIIHHWTGETTTDDLFGYLFSDTWNADLASDLGIAIQ